MIRRSKHKQRQKHYKVRGFANQGKGYGWAVGGSSVRQALKRDLREQYDA